MPFPVGIPLLLVPERVMLEVDASLLLDPLSSQEAGPAPSAGLKRIVAGLIEFWLRPWEF
jgi:hypothetical protein